jgi:Spy/CpxP family protein refolding chaperone
MYKYFIAILFLSFSFHVKAQPSPRQPEKLQLLRELRLTKAQKMQLQQLIKEERLQQYLRDKKLKEILTPEQLKKLQQYKNNPLILPDSTKH